MKNGVRAADSVAGKKLARLVAKQLPVAANGVDGKLRRAAVENQLPDPKAFAKAAGLKYIMDVGPGIKRVGTSLKNFKFVSPTGKVVRDPATLRRIRSLAIPPAWTDVWICPDPDGHVQATGKDARGRKQYRYHPMWRSARDETKFHRMIAFGRALPKIRKVTSKHLKIKGLPKQKVLAAIVQLLEKTLIRVGNDEYAKTNDSFGLTTIQDKHVEVNGGKVNFGFKGKSGVEHEIELNSPGLAKIVKQCQDLPGQELFGYINDRGEQVDVKSQDVNEYLREITGEEFTAKDFRTWNGTVLAAKALQEIEKFTSEAQAKRNVLRAVEEVAKRLGNTRSVCRKCYVHPAVIDAYMDGSLLETLEQQAKREMGNIKALKPEEAAVLAFLQERLRREGARGRKVA
jgi:DNA topoisomerase-1